MVSTLLIQLLLSLTTQLTSKTLLTIRLTTIFYTGTTTIFTSNHLPTTLIHQGVFENENAAKSGIPLFISEKYELNIDHH
jgi:hypothetical protein